MNSKPNIAVIGCGGWGKNLVRVFRDIGNLYGVCDKSGKVIRELNAHDTSYIVGNDYQEFLQDSQIDAMAIATPSETHYTIAKTAILYGKDVFVEKPMVLSSEDGEELVELAKKQERILMVGHVLLYHPAIEDMKRNITKLGEIKSFFSTRYGWVKSRRKENVWWTFATHDVALMLYFMGSPPDKCYALGDQDFGQASFSFNKSKKAYIQVCWRYPLKRRELVILGQNDNFIYKFNEYDENFLRTTDREPLKRECQHFVKCVKTRQTPLTDGNHGLEVVKILEECDSKG